MSASADELEDTELEDTELEDTEADDEHEAPTDRDLAELAATRTFVTTVVGVDDVGPRLRRVTLSGESLATFEPAGPDTFLYFLLPPPGRNELTVDASFSWTEVLPEADRPVGAYYTLRAWRPAARELDVLIVLHGATGPASAWAERAQVGDPVALWGPRSAFHPAAGTDSFLLVADETGLPAVANILEQLPEATPVTVVAEVGSRDDQQDLPTRPTVEVHWLHRDGIEAGTSRLLLACVRDLPLPGAHPYVWGGGESRAMTAVRRHVRATLGLPREQVSLVAYWRHPSGAAAGRA